MKLSLILPLVCVLMTGCTGYDTRGSVMIGQPKQVIRETPMLCPDRTDVTIVPASIRNGIGSVDKDAWTRWFTVLNAEDVKRIEDAVAKGLLVKVTYDDTRPFQHYCNETREATAVEVLDEPVYDNNLRLTVGQ